MAGRPVPACAKFTLPAKPPFAPKLALMLLPVAGVALLLPCVPP